MSTRRRARQVALQVLFQSDLHPEGDIQQQNFIQKRLNHTPALVRFTTKLVGGVKKELDAIDHALQSAANNWSVPRMAVADRNILRIGTFELLFTDTPHKVVIDEAIELAKRFGTNQSYGFVNGILDRVYRAQIAENDSGTPAAAEPTKTEPIDSTDDNSSDEKPDEA